MLRSEFLHRRGLHMLRFILIGLGANLLNFIVYVSTYTLVGELGVSIFFGYLCGILFSFHYGRTWVYGSIYSLSLSLFLRFLIVYCFGLFIMVKLTDYLIFQLYWNLKFSWFVAAGITASCNFLFGRFVIFKSLKL